MTGTAAATLAVAVAGSKAKQAHILIERAEVEHASIIAKAGISGRADLPNYADAPFDLDHAEAMLKLCLPMPEVGCFFHQVNGAVVGLFLGAVSAPWFTPQKEMNEVMFWVRKDYRSSHLAVSLIKRVEEWAKSVGAVKLFLASGSGYDTDRVMKFYNWLGYKASGALASKVLL